MGNTIWISLLGEWGAPWIVFADRVEKQVVALRIEAVEFLQDGCHLDLDREGCGGYVKETCSSEWDPTENGPDP